MGRVRDALRGKGIVPRWMFVGLTLSLTSSLILGILAALGIVGTMPGQEPAEDVPFYGLMLVMLLVLYFLGPKVDVPASPQRMRRPAALHNERLKMTASLCNTVGASAFLTIVVGPLVSTGKIPPLRLVGGSAAVIIAHGAAQAVLTLWRHGDD